MTDVDPFLRMAKAALVGPGESMTIHSSMSGAPVEAVDWAEWPDGRTVARYLSQVDDYAGPEADMPVDPKVAKSWRVMFVCSCGLAVACSSCDRVVCDCGAVYAVHVTKVRPV